MEVSVLNQDGGFSREGVQAIRAVVLQVLAEERVSSPAPEPTHAQEVRNPAKALNEKLALRREIQEVLSEVVPPMPGVSEERVMELIDAHTRNQAASGRLSAVYAQRTLSH